MTITAQQKLDSLVGSILGTYFGKENYETAEEKSVAYFYFIIKNHPFTDGNKRTASLAFASLCQLNGLTFDQTKYTLDELAIYIEKIREDNHYETIRVLARYIFG